MDAWRSIAVATLVLGFTIRVAAEDHAAWSMLTPAARARVTCSIAAAIQFDVPANLLIAVAEQEGGKPGQRQPNRNGTYDVGVMQFNSRYIAALARFGITEADVAAAGCYPYELAAWRLRGHISHDAGDIWTRAANYHSRTPIHNARYRAAIVKRGAKWAHWLSAHFAVKEVTGLASVDVSPPLPAAHTSASQSPAAGPKRPAAAASTIASRRAPSSAQKPTLGELTQAAADLHRDQLAFIAQTYGAARSTASALKGRP